MSKGMIKIVNIVKIILLVFIIIGTVYINLTWFDKMKVSPFSDFFKFFNLVIPYTVLLVFFALDMIREYRDVNNNRFFHLTCFFSLATIIYIIYRAIDDLNMILLLKDGIGSNYYFFNGWSPLIKIMVYFMIIINVLLIIKDYYRKKNLYQ